MKRLNSPSTPTIRDVARLAGVSVATASYSMNQSGRVSDLTREKVKKIAAELGYSPSITAQALRGVKGNIITILTDGFAGPWYGEILEGIQPTLKNLGYSVMALTIQKDSLDLCRNLVEAGLVRGLIVLNPGNAKSEFISALADNVPVAVFDTSDYYSNCYRFVLDNRGGITSLMTHLWNRSYRDFLWLDGAIDSACDAQERWQAFHDFLNAKGLPEESRSRILGGFQAELAHKAVKIFLSTGKIPRVIIGANDESALGAMRAVLELGFKVPEDIAIAGFDGLDMTEYAAPPLTTVHYDRRAIGTKMADCLVQAMAENASRPETIVISVDLLIRAST